MNKRIMKKLLVLILALAMFGSILTGCATTPASTAKATTVATTAAKPAELPVLKYSNKEPLPIPEAEKTLPTITAVPYLENINSMFLEGTVYDRAGNLYLADAAGGKILKITPTKEISVILENLYAPISVKIDKQGRLYICSIGNLVKDGYIISCNPDGSDKRDVIPTSAGYLVDEMVFTNDGGFYFSDFKGNPTSPTGGVYYVSPDFKTITPVVKNLALPNGLVVSADQKTLYITEMGMNRLLIAKLSPTDHVTLGMLGLGIAYHFSGSNPCDSATIDIDGNIYVAIHEQARVLVFNKNGYPIGQILLPGREAGKNTASTHVAIMPGSDQLVISAVDYTTGKGALFTAKGFAKSALEYQFQ